MPNWSTYQQQVFDFVTNGKGSAVIAAVAGSGKTTTIVECAKRIPTNKSVLFLAFNKSIASELSSRLYAYRNVNCCTLHSLGFKAIVKAMGRVNVRYTKYYEYIVNNMEALSTTLDATTSDHIKYNFIHNVNELFNLCRVNLIDGKGTEAIEAIAEQYSIDVVADEYNAVSTLLSTAYKLNHGENIDFTDMLTLAVKQFSRYIPKYDFVFIDECQDLSTAQRELMLAALKPNGRFIAVGDRNQAINGFAGATNNSFDLLAELAKGKELPLSVNYRCGTEIIKLAKEIVPQITACDNACRGKVEHIKDLSIVKGKDMVLSRTTAPLVTLCLKMLANGIVAKVKGKDLGDNLISLIEKLAPKNINFLFQKLDNELEKIKEKKAKKGVKDVDNCTAVIAYKDKIQCLQAFAEQSGGIADMKRKIAAMFSDEAQDNAIILSTIHKAKGLEADRVFIVNPQKLPLKWKTQQAWEYTQECNLKYVAITRAKKELYFVDIEEKDLLKYDFAKDRVNKK